MITNVMGLIEKIGSPSHSPPHQQQQQSSSSLDLDAGKFIKPNFSSPFMSGDANALLNTIRNNQMANGVANATDASLGGSEYELQQEKWRNYFQLILQQQQQQINNFNCKVSSLFILKCLLI